MGVRGSHPDPEIREEGGFTKKTFFRPFGPQLFGPKMGGGGGGASPGSATGLNSDSMLQPTLSTLDLKKDV